MTFGNRLAPAALTALLLSSPAHAVLGEGISSIYADTARLKGDAQRIRSDARYTVHPMTLPSGTTVREYLSPQGKVFGVAWQGPVRPDLQMLLGQHFNEYEKQMRDRRARRQPVHVDTDDLVVTMGGRMRALSGRAYLKSLLPPGVDADEIQ
jgi:hypothetical protein